MLLATVKRRRVAEIRLDALYLKGPNGSFAEFIGQTSIGDKKVRGEARQLRPSRYLMLNCKICRRRREKAKSLQRDDLKYKSPMKGNP